MVVEMFHYFKNWRSVKKLFHFHTIVILLSTYSFAQQAQWGIYDIYQLVHNNQQKDLFNFQFADQNIQEISVVNTIQFC